MKLAAACLVFCVCARGSDDSARVLKRAQQRILDRAERLPNYTCNETVDRRYFQPAKPPRPGASCDQLGAAKRELEASDRIRLEVKVSDGKEIGSWPGASHFDSRSIFDLIGGGTFGTGPLGTALVDVFGNKGATFKFQGEEDKLFVYHFDVPLSSSHYYIQAWGNWRPVAYSGTAWIDPATCDLKHFKMLATELPVETEACQTTTDVKYDRVKTGRGDFLAPRQSTLHFLRRDGTENETSTEYFNCREYQVESALRFDDSLPAKDTQAEKPRPPLTAGVAIPLAFNVAIDSGSAAAGDVIQARTRKAVLDPQSGQVLIPAGAIVEARLTGMRQGMKSPRYVLLSIWLERYQVGGVWSPLSAVLDSKDRIENGRRMIALRGASVPLPSGREPNAAYLDTLIFPAPKHGYILPQGFETNWITTVAPTQ